MPSASLPATTYLLCSGVASDPRFSYAGTSLVLVQDSPLGWEYYSAGYYEWVAFAPQASDVLVAEISVDTSGATIASLAGQSSVVDGVQCGYQTGPGFSVSISVQGSDYEISASNATFTPFYVGQTTQYVYGTAATSSSPALYCNNEVAAVIYPDSTNTYSSSTGWTNGSSGYDRVQYTYDRQGEMTSMEDQNQTTHTYAYDGVGRLLSDSVTVPAGNPADIDMTVASIDYAYKVCGRLLSVSSENSSGTVLNEDYYQYDSNGNLDAEYQDNSGAVDPSNLSAVPYVGYGYDDSTTTEDGMTVSTTDFRPTTLQYPTVPGATTTRTLTYSYGTSGGANDEINQLDSIVNGTTTLDSIGYLGDGTIVSEDYEQPAIGYNLLGTTGGQPNRGPVRPRAGPDLGGLRFEQGARRLPVQLQPARRRGDEALGHGGVRAAIAGVHNLQFAGQDGARGEAEGTQHAGQFVSGSISGLALLNGKPAGPAKAAAADSSKPTRSFICGRNRVHRRSRASVRTGCSMGSIFICHSVFSKIPPFA